MICIDKFVLGAFLFALQPHLIMLERVPLSLLFHLLILTLYHNPESLNRFVLQVQPVPIIDCHFPRNLFPVICSMREN